MARSAVLDEDVTDPRRGVDLDGQIDAVVAAVLAAGWRPVTADDATVETVARAIHDHECDAAEDGHCRLYDLHRKWHIATARFAVVAAVEALRDGSDQ